MQTEEQEIVKQKHPAEMLSEELKMGLDHPSYRFGRKKRQNQGE